MIPRVIHQIWLGGPLPDRYRRFADGWREIHPEWTYRLWDDSDVPASLKNGRAFHSTSSLAQKADILRYEIINKHGGVYIDCDFEAIQPLDSLLEGLSFFSAYQSGSTVAIGIFGSVPRHPVLKDVISRIPQSFLVRRTITAQTGPDLFTEAVQEHLRRNPQDFSTAVFRHEYFYPLRPWEPALDQPAKEVYPRSFGLHHWDKSWSNDELAPQPYLARLRASSLTAIFRSAPLALSDSARTLTASTRSTASTRAKRYVRRLVGPTRAPVVVPVAGDRLLISTVHGFSLVADSSDLGITPHLATTGSYERNVIDYLLRTTPRGATAIDVGANIGIHTIALAKAVGPGGRVFSYECNPLAESILRDNVRLNSATSTVELRSTAASDHVGELTLFFSSRQLGLGSVVKHAAETPTTESTELVVRCAPVYVDGDVDVIKIDVEGAEAAVLRGLMPMVRAGRVRRILVELKQELLGDTWGEIKDMLREFDSVGMRFAAIDQFGVEDRLSLTDVLVIGDFGNLLIERPPTEAGRS